MFCRRVPSLCVVCLRCSLVQTAQSSLLSACSYKLPEFCIENAKWLWERVSTLTVCLYFWDCRCHCYFARKYIHRLENTFFCDYLCHVDKCYTIRYDPFDIMFLTSYNRVITTRPRCVWRRQLRNIIPTGRSWGLITHRTPRQNDKPAPRYARRLGSNVMATKFICY